MRVLHKAAEEETIIARGRYQYLVDEAPTGQIETWQLSTLPDGTTIFRSDLDGRLAETPTNLIAHLRRQPDGRPAWLRLRYTSEDRTAAAHYNFDPAVVKVFRQVQGNTRREEVMDIAEGYEIDYHAVIAHDYVWRGYPEHARGQQWAMPVFSPDLWADDGDTLIGRALRFFVKPGQDESIEVPAGTFENIQHFMITMDDDVKALAWFDEHGVPLRWYYPEKSYDFVLTDYIRR